MLQIYKGDSINILEELEDSSIDLVYMDPPFNTGQTQKGRQDLAYPDRFEDYQSFLHPILEIIHRKLSDRGSLYVHLDYRESHRVKLFLDSLFGEDNFVNEIIWAYDYGGRSKRKWPAKHDTILFYSKTNAYIFNESEVDRIPYMAPGLAGPEKAARGKFPTDVWWHTIVPTQGSERTGYPTQKPVGILKRIIQASSDEDSLIVDPFAGSGTTGVAALSVGRGNIILIDQNEQAIDIMKNRFNGIPYVFHGSE